MCGFESHPIEAAQCVFVLTIELCFGCFITCFDRHSLLSIILSSVTLYRQHIHHLLLQDLRICSQHAEGESHHTIYRRGRHGELLGARGIERCMVV